MLDEWGIKRIIYMADIDANLPTASSDKRKQEFRRRLLIADVAKRRFVLTPEQIIELQECIAACSHAPTRTRYEAILLYGTGVPVEEITKRLGCSRASLMNWCQAYRSMGIKRLKDQREGGNNARLSPQQLEDLSYRLNQFKPRMLFGSAAATPAGEQWTVEDLYRAIQHWYSVVYQSRTSYYDLLSLCGSGDPLGGTRKEAKP